ncbi:MAG: NUDIX domain-containing protein [Flavobacteriales bacterium]|mgnify:FL=1
MYKVFFNRTELLIVEKGQLNNLKFSYENRIVLEEESFKTDFTSWLKSNEEVSKIIICKNENDYWAEFKKQFLFIEAAGGLVRNENKELLTIFRNGVWDLPKGKVEKGELIEEAAVREVEEETGVKIHKHYADSIQKVYHVYSLKKKLVLKETSWFIMSAKSMILLPQREEGITKVCWMSELDLEKIFAINTYLSIKILLNY